MGHVWLIGMMGSGKTTVGAALAERLDLPLIDTDTVVMERSGATIPELFADSEERFRALEHDAIDEIASGPRSVVATGGGAILDDRNVVIMQATGTLVLLTARADILRDRLGSDQDRPLLTDPGAVERILDERWPRYVASAQHVVDTVDRDIDAIADEVVACIDM